MNTEQLIAVIHQIAEKIEAEKAFLTELDNVIGDGDHGINLARGFGEVEKKLDSLKDKEPGDVVASADLPGGSPEAAWNEFMADHAKVWMPEFAATCEKDSHVPFYRTAASLLGAFIGEM